ISRVPPGILRPKSGVRLVDREVHSARLSDLMSMKRSRIGLPGSNFCNGSSRFQHAHLHVQTRCRSHVDQCIEAEQVDLAAHQVRNAWLRYAEQLGGLCL